MNPVDTPMDSFSALEGTVAFRFAVSQRERIAEQELADEFGVGLLRSMK